MYLYDSSLYTDTNYLYTVQFSTLYLRSWFTIQVAYIFEDDFRYDIRIF